MTQPEIQPALTADEWSNVVVYRGNATHPINFGAHCYDGIHSIPCDPELAGERHKLAALCLYQQPFGFTQQDVELIRSASVVAHCDDIGFDEEELDRLQRESLAARIAALLPPPSTDPTP